MSIRCGAAAAALLLATSIAHAQHGAAAQNMALLGHHDLQGRSAYQPVIKESRGRWIAYVGHHGGKTLNSLTGREEDNGTSIVDVTDPRRPRYLAHIPGEPGQAESGGAQMVRVCNGSELPAVKNSGDKSKVYMLRNFGNRAHEVWDVTNPEKPARIAAVVENLRDTHKSWWECDSGIAYLVSGLPDWRVRRMTQIYDLADPAQPRFIRNFGLVGQQPGATGTAPTELHGMISTGEKRNRIYFGYGTNKSGVLQIVDATDEKTPVSIATYTVPESSGNFCSRGGRFGAHSSNENQPPMYAGRYVFVAWFNAGVRALDISDPYHPKEAGYYVPATTEKTDKRCVKDASGERCKVAIQTNNLDVDDRGYIYAVDRANTGLHIIEFKH